VTTPSENVRARIRAVEGTGMRRPPLVIEGDVLDGGLEAIVEVLA
jgi:hypothetical protein